MSLFRSHPSNSYSAQALLCAVVEEAEGRGTYRDSDESPRSFIDRTIDYESRSHKERPRSARLKHFLDIEDVAGLEVCGLRFMSLEATEPVPGGGDSLFLVQTCPTCGAGRPALELLFTESVWDDAPTLVKEEVDRLTKGRSILGGKLQLAWCCYANAARNRAALFNFLKGRAAGESHFCGPCPSCGNP